MAGRAGICRFAVGNLPSEVAAGRGRPHGRAVDVLIDDAGVVAQKPPAKAVNAGKR